MATPLDVGAQLGPYRLIEKLGAGAFGEAWLVAHHSHDVRQVMKVPTDPEYCELLRREGRIQFRLSHEGIVTVTDLDLRADPPYIVMEHLEGGDLRRHLKAVGPLPELAARQILEQVLEALEHAHRQGVVHRDLKPENVLLGADGRVKLADFGLGQLHDELARSILLSGGLVSSQGVSMAGTIDYMSPEQRAGEPAGPSDDVYAVGVIGCELLTGRRPAGAGVAKTLERAGVGPALCAWLETACDEAPYRHASAAAMLAALREPAPVGAAHPDWPDTLFEVLEPWVTDSGLYLDPSIPERKLRNARSKCEIPEEETVLALIDLTLFGSAKNSIVFTESGLYYRNDWTGKRPGRGYVAYGTLARRTIESAGVWEVSLGRGDSVDTSGATISKKDLIHLLQQVQAALEG